MKNILKSAVTVGALAFSLSQASATSITGTINLATTKDITVNSTDFTTVTFVDFAPNSSDISLGANAIVTSGTGSFTGLGGTTALFSDFTVGGPAVTPLWQLGVPGWSFDLLSSANTSLDNNTLRVQGTGTLHGPGLSDTPGVFIFSANRSGGGSQISFSFSGSTTAVPDGGATVILLGTGLVGIGLIRRRLS